MQSVSRLLAPNAPVRNFRSSQACFVAQVSNPKLDRLKPRYIYPGVICMAKLRRMILQEVLLFLSSIESSCIRHWPEAESIFQLSLCPSSASDFLLASHRPATRSSRKPQQPSLPGLPPQRPAQLCWRLWQRHSSGCPPHFSCHLRSTRSSLHVHIMYPPP